jgi:glutaredoxin
MKNIILYSTGCPKCNILKKKLTEKNIDYIENKDIKEMIALGIDHVPVLVVDGEKMEFGKANQWINEQ